MNASSHLNLNTFFDGMVIVPNWIWDGRVKTKHHSVHYIAAAWPQATGQGQLTANIVPLDMALRWPKYAWRFRPGLRRAESPSVSVLNVWGPEWREASHMKRPLPVDRTVRAIRRALRSLSISRPLLMISEPAHWPLIGQCSEVASVWFCSDDFAAGDSRRAGSIRANEAEMLARVDLVLAVSPTLVNGCRDAARHVVLFPNAVDVEEMRKMADFPGPVEGWPADPLPRPRVVYLGCLNRRVDYNAVCAAARRHPGASFMFVGPEVSSKDDPESARGIAELKKIPNTFFLGKRDRGDVAWILSQCDVGIVPYVNSAFNQACSPLKVYEYSALDMATVTTPLPAVQAYGDDIILALPDMLADTLGDTFTRLPELKKRAAEFARRHTWVNRVRALVAEVEKIHGA